jgi:acetylornithine deacetylase/succinyl-diaminopimelate desuccinylase-like protein
VSFNPNQRFPVEYSDTLLEKQAIAEAPVNDGALRQELGLGHIDGGGRKLLELLNLPSLNINGMAAANVGTRANNVIPSRAVADLDLRLIVGEHWQEQQKRVIDYIHSQGYFVVDSEPPRDVLLANPRVAMVKGDEFSYDAVRTPMDLPIAKEVIAAVESARGKVVKWPTMGGSVPLGAIERAANTHTITVPIANHDNNQHSSNENIRLQSLGRNRNYGGADADGMISAKIRTTQKKRTSESKVVPVRRNRTLSAAARKKIAAAHRARWAKVKAAKKTA